LHANALRVISGKGFDQQIEAAINFAEALRHVVPFHVTHALPSK